MAPLLVHAGSVLFASPQSGEFHPYKTVKCGYTTGLYGFEVISTFELFDNAGASSKLRSIRVSLKDVSTRVCLSTTMKIRTKKRYVKKNFKIFSKNFHLVVNVTEKTFT